MYRPPVITTNAKYHTQLTHPLVLNVMPSNLVVPQVTSINTSSSIPSEIINRKEEDDSLEKQPKDKTAKRIFVKIAPKPVTYTSTKRFLDTMVMPSDSKSQIISQNNILIGPTVESLECVGDPHPNDIQNCKRSDAKLAKMSIVPNTRPHCPVQLSAAIALSELAAKTEEGSLASINEDHSTQNFGSHEEFGHPGSKLPAEIEEPHVSTSNRLLLYSYPCCKINYGYSLKNWT